MTSGGVGFRIREPACVRVHRALRERISTLDLPPGTQISEAETAERYHVSRQPVREAFIKLSDDCLLDIRPNRGSYVRRISVAKVLAARFMREAIEADIVRLAATRSNPTHVAKLQGYIDVQRETLSTDQSMEADQMDRFFQADYGMHSYMARLAGQPAAWTALENFRIQMKRVRHLSKDWPPRERLIEEHQAIVDAIAMRDADAAEAALRTHLRYLVYDLSCVVAQHEAFFEQDIALIDEGPIGISA